MLVTANVSVENCVISGVAGNGLEVFAPANIRVADTLLARNGAGMYFGYGASVDIVNTQVQGNAGAGLNAHNESGSSTTVAVTNSAFSRNLFGVVAFGESPGGKVAVTISGSTVDHGGTGFYASAPAGVQASITVSGTKVTHNSIGLQQVGVSVIKSTGDNVVTDNATNAMGTITPMGTM